MEKHDGNKSENVAFCRPNFGEAEIEDVVRSREVLGESEKYKKALKRAVMLKYQTSKIINGTEFSYTNILDLNKLFIEKNIINLFESSELSEIFSYFFDVKMSFEEDAKLFNKIFEFEVWKDKILIDKINQMLNKYLVSLSDINFSFSAVCLLLNILALRLQKDTYKNLAAEEKIRFFYEEILLLKKDGGGDEAEQLEEEQKEEGNEEYLPDSDTLTKVKNSAHSYSKEDKDFISDLLQNLDKNLPQATEDNALKFANKPSHLTDFLLYYGKINADETIPKFPVERLGVEVEMEKERALAEKERRLIEKAKKAKKKQKEKNENPYEAEFDEVPDEKKHDEKYMGKEHAYTLTNRLVKNTFKEIIGHSNVYPSIIKEVLMIPKQCSQKVMELAIESMEDQINGKFENAIKRLEKAMSLVPKDINYSDWQLDLYFNLSLGSCYESLGYDLAALKYYYDSIAITQKMLIVDPDIALPYCFIGELFVKMEEFVWALRAFNQAKKIREDTIGGDTPDTATVYNNLGVVCFCLESYLPAMNYFKLAYEIYKNLLGLTHPRTITIKGNLTKMNGMNFNRQVEFKPLSLYPLPGIMTKNPKKGKRK